MKRVIKLSLLLLTIICVGAAGNKASSQEVSVSYQTFYDDLSPYGQWIQNSDYGYVWHPNVADFRPYNTNGHWVWTDDYGWMWASEYDWGWAPFHYGRWAYDNYYGWLWIPGHEWSPAWVQWRTGGEYYGWAPLGPGITISANLSTGRYSAPANYWCFVPRNNVTATRVYDYCLPQARNTVIINNTTIVNNYRRTRNVVASGPRRGEVERYAGHVNPFVVRQSRTAGRAQFASNTVNIYRPQVQKRAATNTAHLAPRNFQTYDRQKGTAFQQQKQKQLQQHEQEKNKVQQRQSQEAQQKQLQQQQVQQREQQQQQRQSQEQHQKQTQLQQQQVQQHELRQKQLQEQRQNQQPQQQQQQVQQREQQQKQLQQQRQNQEREQKQKQLQQQQVQQKQLQQQKQQQDQQRKQDVEKQQSSMIQQQHVRQQQQQRNNTSQQKRPQPAKTNRNTPHQ